MFTMLPRCGPNQTKMENKPTIAIYVPDNEAKQFLVFREHYDIFSILIEKKVFDTRNGSVALHFDNNGTLQSIQRADFMYSRRFDKP